jgi:hypothetical protein
MKYATGRDILRVSVKNGTNHFNVSGRPKDIFFSAKFGRGRGNSDSGFHARAGISAPATILRSSQKQFLENYGADFWVFS